MFHLWEELCRSPLKWAGAGFIKMHPSPHLQAEL